MNDYIWLKIPSWKVFGCGRLANGLTKESYFQTEEATRDECGFRWVFRSYIGEIILNNMLRYLLYAKISFLIY